MIKLIAFDLDGTLTQHKTPLSAENRAVLEALSKKYRLVMAGAGQCERIFNQLGQFPIDVIGNYGMQYAKYNADTKSLDIVRNEVIPCDRESIERRVTELRNKHGFTQFAGDNVEFHPSGCVTIPLLGTKARQEDKLAFDPDRTKRRAFYSEVKELFPEFTVFVGGSSSFDMSPAPYDKAYALDLYCKEHNIYHSETAFVGDDYGEGGNDESVFLADFNFIKIDNYLDFSRVVEHLL